MSGHPKYWDQGYSGRKDPIVYSNYKASFMLADSVLLPPSERWYCGWHCWLILNNNIIVLCTSTFPRRISETVLWCPIPCRKKGYFRIQVKVCLILSLTQASVSCQFVCMSHGGTSMAYDIFFRLTDGWTDSISMHIWFLGTQNYENVQPECLVFPSTDVQSSFRFAVRRWYRHGHVNLKCVLFSEGRQTLVMSTCLSAAT